MRVLKAPDTHTRDRITSEGEVHFENGIATEFTKEQAALFCENLPGYEVVEIADEEPVAEIAPKEEVEEEAPVTAEPESVPGEPGEQIETDPGEPETGPGEPEPEKEKAPEETTATIYDKALDRKVGKAKTRVIHEFGKQPSNDILAELIIAEGTGRNRSTMIAWLEDLITEDEEQPPDGSDDASGEPETGTEEEPPIEPETGPVEPVESEIGPGLPVEETVAEEEAPSTEEPGEPETGPGEPEITEETKPMEETGDGPPEPGIADDDRSPDGQDDVLPESPGEEPGGQEEQPQIEGEESEKEKIVLPVIQDDIKVVRAFALKHGISADGGKGEILERIYADQRFK